MGTFEFPSSPVMPSQTYYSWRLMNISHTKVLQRSKSYSDYSYQRHFLSFFFFFCKTLSVYHSNFFHSKKNTNIKYFLKTITISQKHIWQKPSYFFFGWILGLVDVFFFYPKVCDRCQGMGKTGRALTESSGDGFQNVL